MTAFALADGQAEDGRSPDVGLLVQSEHIWAGLYRRNPKDPMIRSHLVIVRRRLAEELAGRGEAEEAKEWSRRSLESARGDVELLYSLAADYAQKARITGTYPTRLDAAGLRQRRRRFVAEAVAMLRRASVDGLEDAARLHCDHTFDAIRSDPAFAAVRADIEFPADPFASR